MICGRSWDLGLFTTLLKDSFSWLVEGARFGLLKIFMLVYRTAQRYIFVASGV